MARRIASAIALFCSLVAGHSDSALYTVYGGNLLGPSYYYQLQLENRAVILELRSGDLLATRAALDATLADVRRFAPRADRWADLSEWDGSLLDENGKLIGRLNCQLQAMSLEGNGSCQEDKAMVMKLAADAGVEDRTYAGNDNAQFHIFSHLDSYSFELRVRDSLLLWGDELDLQQAQAAVAAIKSGAYSFETRTVRIGPVRKRSIRVLVDAEGKMTATVNVEFGLDSASVENYIRRYSLQASVDGPSTTMLV